MLDQAVNGSDVQQGIPQATLDKIKVEYQDIPLKVMPSSPMISQEILDAIPRKHLDVAYASDSDTQKIDLYLPPESDGLVPVLAFIHGGAFMFGDKQDMQVTTYMGLINHGYAVASIGYRLAPDAHFPAPIQDVKAAIRFLKAHGTEYGIDPARVAVAGQSSGANYALMVATTPNIDFFENKSMGNPGYDATVNCAIALFPVVDFTTVGAQHEENGTGKNEPAGPEIPECQYLGGVLADFDADYVAQSNPTTFITKQIPPLLMKCGHQDAMVPFQQSRNFVDKVREIAGEDRVDFEIVEGAGHADPPFKQPTMLRDALAFLDAHMK